MWPLNLITVCFSNSNQNTNCFTCDGFADISHGCIDEKNYLSNDFIQRFSVGQHSGNKCSLLLVTEELSVVKYVS